jgi:hypothetical protein
MGRLSSIQHAALARHKLLRHVEAKAEKEMVWVAILKANPV